MITLSRNLPTPQCFPLKKIKFESKNRKPRFLKACLNQLKERIRHRNLTLILLIFTNKKNSFSTYRNKVNHL